MVVEEWSDWQDWNRDVHERELEARGRLGPLACLALGGEEVDFFGQLT